MILKRENKMKIKMLLTLAFRYMKYRKLATILSIFAIGLSLLFLIFVGTIGFSMANSAVTSSIKYPLIIGPEGSSGTQVVMSTIFHIDTPSGLLNFNVLKELKKEPDVIDAYPIARADNYMSIPIIGTTAISILFFVLFLFFGSYILNFFFFKGNEYFTILKLISCINGTKISLFFLFNLFIKFFVLTSFPIDKYNNIFLYFLLESFLKSSF
jgi:hypothetical protein